MAAFDLFFRVIDRFVDGDVAIVQGRKHKYTIPTCFKDLYWPRYDEPTHGKYEAYRDVEHLVAQARCAMEQEDIRPFFRIYCLFAELNKQNGQNTGSALCGTTADGKHLDYESNLTSSKRLVRSDKKAMMYMKTYAWFMEGIVPIPIGRFKLGASSLAETIPFMGALGVFITSFLMYSRTCQSITAPSWLWKEMLRPLIWAIFFAFFMPEVGDIAASSISPSRRAARKVKHWLKLRSLLSRDQQYEDGSWQSRGLARVFPDPSTGADSYEWRYTNHFRKQLYGEGLLHLRKEDEV
ncbi:hypothetical protein LQV05_004743 [Cryptococcus neoformans]|nr:hypothetical protein J007_03822 [Cryptococcus neoformans var. grubii]OXC60649.1 hypothetical protein C358_03916 [Cryptococcus neoformans var. grubii MW-RSA852]UOH82058.1 hypothetical protein LQV05_004743 [Cryptococcus neoformans]